jgi:hypothetical protein
VGAAVEAPSGAATAAVSVGDAAAEAVAAAAPAAAGIAATVAVKFVFVRVAWLRVMRRLAGVPLLLLLLLADMVAALC